MITVSNNLGNFGVTLSIVIISRNEAKNIARAIESVLRAVGRCSQIEILLVDSASTDETVEIASHYPINIVRLKPGWFLSVSAGRHIGMHYSRGELILHMDGDMELEPNWIAQSVNFMLEHPDVGAVGGYWRNMQIKIGQIANEEDETRDPLGRVLEVKYVGGAAVYRRIAIQKMGGFQPFIKGEEGVYLSMGIRNAGYKVIRLPILMSWHYCIPRQSLAGNLRKFRFGFLYGHGQVLRAYRGSRLFWIYLQERSIYTVIYFISLVLLFLFLLLSIIFKNIFFLGSIVLIFVAVILVFAVKKRSLRDALKSCLVQTLVAYSTLRGFFLPVRPSAEYPNDAEIVQVHFNLGGFE